MQDEIGIGLRIGLGRSNQQLAVGNEPKAKPTATTQAGLSCFMHHLTNIKRAAPPACSPRKSMLRSAHRHNPHEYRLKPVPVGVAVWHFHYSIAVANEQATKV